MGDARYLAEENVALIIGGHGRTAQHLTELLVARSSSSHPRVVHSLIRSSAQIPDIEALGAHAIVQDLVAATVDDLRAIIERVRPNTVFWAASDPRAPEPVARDGAIKVIEALAASNLSRKRYVAISAADVRDREHRPTPDWYSEADLAMSNRMWGVIGPALRAKFEADRSLAAENERRGIEYTIIRPGGLSEAEATGRVRAGKVGLTGLISRRDLAEALFAASEEDGTAGLAFDLLGPGEQRDLPVKDEIRRVGREREDTFKGYY